MGAAEEQPWENYEVKLIFRIRGGSGARQGGFRRLTKCAGKLEQLAESLLAEEFDGSPELVSAELNWGLSPSARKRSRRAAVGTVPPKKDLILDLLGRDEGATMEDLQDATGWRRNTISSQLTYLAKLGSRIERDRSGSVLRYRLEK